MNEMAYSTHPPQSQPFLHPSWSVRYSPGNTGIPEYNAAMDPHCPLTKTDRFRKHMKEVRAAAMAQTATVGSTGQVYRSKSQGDLGKQARLGSAALDHTVLPTSMRPMDYLSVSQGAPGSAGKNAPGSSAMSSVLMKGPQNLSTKSGGVTFQPDSTVTYGRDDTVSPEQVNSMSSQSVRHSLTLTTPPAVLRAARQHCNSSTTLRTHSTNSSNLLLFPQELEVLKAILLREGYLHRIEEVALSKEALTSVPQALPDLLDLMRIATVEVVEAIQKWRQAQARPLPFDWNGVNYLVKVPSDLDFLCDCKPLITWLGFSMSRNPFAVPLAMEHGRNQSVHIAGQGGVPASGVEGFTGIGTVGNVTVTGLGTEARPAVSERVRNSEKQQGRQHGEKDPEKALKEEKEAARAAMRKEPQGKPYLTQVVNDPLLVAPKPPKHEEDGGLGGQTNLLETQGGGEGGGAGGQTEGGAPMTEAQIARSVKKELMSSQVPDLDMLRVRECEKVLLKEEAQHGKWQRDPSGRLVPASQVR